MTGHFLSIDDWTSEALLRTLERAKDLKCGGDHGQPLAGKNVALIFHKRSTRTRVSFEVGIRQLGGDSVFLYQETTHMGQGEDSRDTARVLGRYVDGIMVRTYAHDTALELAELSGVPVVNGLTDHLHPCQVMADVMTATEALDQPADALRVAWVGDGNNMANSWLNAAKRFGFSLTLACPEGYDPDADLVANAVEHAAVRVVRDPREAVEGASVVTTDVWTSMGQEAERLERLQAFRGFQVDDALMGHAAPEGIFMHCMPAHRGEEVTAQVLDGPRSYIFDEAENRLHVQKSILVELFA
ncbi:MAG: ornithine carbamoyltransferase [Myxococcota bacterium]|jgi:ornithine carbamoyltransferase